MENLIPPLGYRSRYPAQSFINPTCGDIDFTSFNHFLRQAASDATAIMNSFETPPEFQLWNNPVVERARESGFLNAGGGRSLTNDMIFSNCNAENLCDDGSMLIEGGINRDRRLWLIYQFDSLTDFNRRSNYTSATGLISVAKTDESESQLFLGFGWNRNDTLTRLTFDAAYDTLRETVFHASNWRSVHSVTHTTKRGITKR